jgi:hypothetical protein
MRTPLSLSRGWAALLAFLALAAHAPSARGELLYVSNQGNGTISQVTPAGQVSTFASGFSVAAGLAFNAQGDLFVGNHGNGTISEVTPTGQVSTLASGLSGPTGLAFNTQGNLFVGLGNNVSEVTPGGVVGTFASGFDNARCLAFAAQVT